MQDTSYTRVLFKVYDPLIRFSNVLYGSIPNTCEGIGNETIKTNTLQQFEKQSVVSSFEMHLKIQLNYFNNSQHETECNTVDSLYSSHLGTERNAWLDYRVGWNLEMRQ